MKKGIILLSFMLIIPYILYGQHTKDTVGSIADKGFDFIIGGGIYFANKFTANYYNGSPQNENSINYILGNKYYYDDINKLIKETHQYVSDSVFLGELPTDMRYKAPMTVSLGFKYKFNKNWGISLYYSFTKLTATDIFTFVYKGEQGNIRNDYIQEHLVGKESRSLFDLYVSYLFHPSQVVKPFIDFGFQFNYVKVQKFYALIEGQEFNLLDYYNGVSYIQGIERQEYNTIYGGAGYGISLATGVKLAFNRYISIDPTFYLSASSFNLTGYKDIRLNYGVFIRVIMSDLVFGK